MMRRHAVKTRDATRTALIGRIPDVRGGDPIILGTRITVTDVLRYLLDDASALKMQERESLVEKVDAVLASETLLSEVANRVTHDIPHLTPMQVAAALRYFRDNGGEILDLLVEEDTAFRQPA